ncbi:MAG: sodium:solute symporter [Anaerolineae bacterium]|nr:sodium:solute symporter [Anaerolineae bacterium]
MAILSPSRAVNPRLGSYFGIFLSGFTAIALMSFILYGLGVDPSTLSLAMLLGPIGLYVAIGIATHASDPLDFFAAGRRVPAFFNGLVLAMSAFGATGLVALTGLLFLIGFDALFIAIGALAGFVIMAVLLAPFLRKFGAFTIASYLGRRFESRPLRFFAAILISVPMLMVLSAELRFAAEAVVLLSGWSHAQAFLLLYAVLLATCATGGMRSMTWAGVAQSLAAFAALMVPVIIVAAIVTTMPVPQLTHGPVLRAVGRNEAMEGLPIILPPMMAFDLPGPELQPIFKRFADPFGAIGSAAFMLGTLSMMAGVASAPWLLPRLAAAPGVYEARKTLGWATFVFGVAMLTASSIAVFLRDYLMDLIVTSGPAVVPPWLADLAKRGLASITETGTQFTAQSISFARDGVFLSLPVAAQLPPMLLDLSLAAVVAGGLVAASSAATALGHVLSEDLVFGRTWDPPHGPARLHAGRAGIAVAAATGILAAAFATTDPLRVVLSALALGGSALFPVLVLSIWWKRMNASGAMAGMLTGFFVALLVIAGGQADSAAIPGALAAIAGVPAAIAAVVAVSFATPAPRRHVLELVRDIRVPGGEILYDREMRTQRLKKQRQLA